MRVGAGGRAALRLAALVGALAVLASVARANDAAGQESEAPKRSIVDKLREFWDRVMSEHRLRQMARVDANSAGPGTRSKVYWSKLKPGRGRNRKSSNGAGDESAGEGGEGGGGLEWSNFDAKCYVSRGPNFRRSTKLLFYPARKHSQATLGCQVDEALQLKLKPLDGQLDTASPRLDGSAIRHQLLDSHLFDPNLPSFFLVHGFMVDWQSEWICRLKDLILNKTAANVFIVDWSGGAMPRVPVDYTVSVSNTKYVGALLGEFINALVALTGQPNAHNYHLIGHSLGAHICGFAGYAVGSVGQITALDPAGPCFHSHKPTGANDHGRFAEGKRRLSKQSADFVVALHTDVGLFGLNENCGHYDIYVNGGFKQPKCLAAPTLGERIKDLLHFNFQTFDTDFSCAHGYGHDMLQTVIDFIPGHDMAPAGQSDGQLVPHLPLDDRCYQVAYKCATWAAFKAGECGFCRDNDTHCFYAGVSLFQYQPNPEALGHGASYKTVGQDESQDEEEDDDEFNDENEEFAATTSSLKLNNNNNNNNKKAVEKRLKEAEKRNKESERRSNKFMRYQHFMRTASGLDTCLYHYQVVVATRTASDQLDVDVDGNDISSARRYFYLHLPLDSSGQLTDSQGNRKHDRLIQVSHRVRPGSASFARLQSAYVAALKEQPELELEYEDCEDGCIEFYTALITFQRAPNEVCEAIGGETPARSTNDHHFQLCAPLRNLQEARLWSASEQQLNSLAWVGLNYMSALSYGERLAHSYHLARDPRERVHSRADIEQSGRARLGDMKVPAAELGGKTAAELWAGDLVENAADLVEGAADCFLSLFDRSDQSRRRRNFKCNRSSKELKFAIYLKPSRLGDQRA